MVCWVKAEGWVLRQRVATRCLGWLTLCHKVLLDSFKECQRHNEQIYPIFYHYHKHNPRRNLHPKPVRYCRH